MKPIRDESGKFPAYAWPGGYQILYYTKDGGCLCPACANGENGSEATEKPEPADPQWQLVAMDIFYEGAPIQCDHCNATIESAYGDPEGEDD